MDYIKQRVKLLKDAIVKMAYIDEHIHDITNYHVMKHNMITSMMNSKESGITSNLHTDRELVVSLTTYGNRVDSVFQTIESLFQQSLKANRVVLYLSKSEFNKDNLPVSLRLQMRRGLEVRFVKDIRAYTKLVPALLEFPEADIVTVDDDYMYQFNMLEKLMQAHKEVPKAVCCFNSRLMRMKNNSELQPYNLFEIVYPSKNDVSLKYMAEGFGGVLYPAHCMHKDVYNEEIFMKLSPYADDLWFKGMQLLVDTPVLQIARNQSWFHKICSEQSVQDTGLVNVNVGQSRNDPQLKSIFDYYDLYQKLQ